MNGSRVWALLFCPTCGRAPLPLAAAGDEATCPSCGRLLQPKGPAPTPTRPVPVSLVRTVPVSVVPRQSPAAPSPTVTRRIGFQCPYCGTQELPRRYAEVSGAGWALLMVLLAGVATIPLCWIGLLLQESYHRCVGCGMRFG